MTATSKKAAGVKDFFTPQHLHQEEQVRELIHSYGEMVLAEETDYLSNKAKPLTLEEATKAILALLKQAETAAIDRCIEALPRLKSTDAVMLAPTYQKQALAALKELKGSIK